MDNAFSDAQLIWPLQTPQGLRSNCSTESGVPIFPNTTGTSICGLHNNRAVAESCCRNSVATEVREYQCWQYCEYNSTIFDWAECIGRVTNSSTQRIPYYPFCQEALVPRSTSSSHRVCTPKVGWLALALIFTFLLIGPAQATVIHSLSDGNDLLDKRQSNDGCTFTIEHTYASEKHGTQAVSNIFSGFSGVGSVGIVTPVDGNNRTINSTSAADRDFDDFFDIVSKGTNGRRFPAMSSIELKRGVAVYSGATATGTSFYFGWTPISFCVNGTVTGCNRTLEGAQDGSYVEACGPTFVNNSDPDYAIQGILSPVFIG